MFANVDELIALADQVPDRITRDLRVVGEKDQGGRNNKLKGIVAASLEAGEDLGVFISKLIRYDQEQHDPPLFSDNTDPQMRDLDVQSNALRFVYSVMSSINRQRQMLGLPQQYFRLSGHELCSSRREGDSLFVSATQLLDNMTPPVYIIDGLIEENTDAMLFGPSGGGKTFISLDVGCAIATGGQTLQGHKCAQGIVLYLAGEGYGGLKKRLGAWAKHNGKASEDLKCFHISTITVSFDGSGLEDVATKAKQLENDLGMPVKLIIIDTLARHMIGDENNAGDAGKYNRSLGKLRQSITGCSTLTVHHIGHGQGTKDRPRGSSAFNAAMDCVISCDKGRLTFTKLKDSEFPQPIAFKLMPIELLLGDGHEQATSCYVEYGATSEKNRHADLTEFERVVVQFLEKAEVGMSKSDLRKAFKGARLSENPEEKTATVTRSCTRALEGLINKKLIILDGDQYMLTSKLA